MASLSYAGSPGAFMAPTSSYTGSPFGSPGGAYMAPTASYPGSPFAAPSPWSGAAFGSPSYTGCFSPGSVQFAPARAPRIPRVVTMQLGPASPPPPPAPSPATPALSPLSLFGAGSPVGVTATAPPATQRSTLPSYPTLLRSSARSPSKSSPRDKQETIEVQVERLFSEHAPGLKEAVPIEERVARFFSERAPGLKEQHGVKVICAPVGAYEIHGRQVEVQWRESGYALGEGRLVVVDGPLRQPLVDYLEGRDANAEYEAVVADTIQNAVHTIPMERRISFRDDDKEYSRLDAMKVAKEQAAFRERAANYLQAGRAPPEDIMAAYTKTIQQKLKPVCATKLRERGATLLRSPTRT